jgi:hypothetical protein
MEEIKMGKKETSDSQYAKLIRIAEELEQKAAKEQEFLHCMVHRLDASALRVAVAKLQEQEAWERVPY